MVSRGAGMLTMDFPARPAAPCEAPAGLLAALGGAPREVLRAMGKQADVVLHDGVPRIYRSLPFADQVVQSSRVMGSYEAAIILECDSIHRTRLCLWAPDLACGQSGEGCGLPSHFPRSKVRGK